jgi:hypothetical protein
MPPGKKPGHKDVRPQRRQQRLGDDEVEALQAICEG